MRNTAPDSWWIKYVIVFADKKYIYLFPIWPKNVKYIFAETIFIVFIWFVHLNLQLYTNIIWFCAVTKLKSIQKPKTIVYFVWFVQLNLQFENLQEPLWRYWKARATYKVVLPAQNTRNLYLVLQNWKQNKKTLKSWPVLGSRKTIKHKNIKSGSAFCSLPLQQN